MKSYIPCKRDQKKTGKAIFASVFKTKTVIRDKEGYCIIKVSMHQENMTIVNRYTCSIEKPHLLSKY